MNINENKSIENAEPTLYDEICAGDHPDIERRFTEGFQTATSLHMCTSEEAIISAVEQFRKAYGVTNTMATRCIQEILWQHIGVQTTKEEQA